MNIFGKYGFRTQPVKLESSFVESQDCPKWLVQLFADGWPAKSEQIQGFQIYDFEAIRTVNCELLDLDGFLIFGTCLNGDMMAINLFAEKESVGFIGHERTDDEYPWVELNENFELFLRDLVKGNLPIDFFAATNDG